MKQPKVRVRVDKRITFGGWRVVAVGDYAACILSVHPTRALALAHARRIRAAIRDGKP